MITKLSNFLKDERRTKALLPWLLALLVILGFFTKLMKKQFGLTEHIIYPSTLIKILIFGLFFMFLITQQKRKHLLWLVVLVTIFSLGLLSDSLNGFPIFYYDRLNYLSKYIFALVAFWNFNNLFSNPITKTMIEMLKKIGVVNAIFLVLGILLQIEIFSTYPFSSRHGYDGIISLQGEATFFYMFLISVTYIEWIQKKEESWKLIIFVISALLAGTKALLLFVFLLTLIHILFVCKDKILKLSTILTLIAGLFFSNFLMKFIVKIFPYAQNLIAEHGLMAFVTSERNLLFLEAKGFISNNWSTMNYLFGGINYSEHRVEFEPVDVFLFFGSVGIILFLSWLFSLYKKTSLLFKILYSIILLVGFLSGSLFTSILNALLFAICISYLKQIMDSSVNHNTLRGF